MPDPLELTVASDLASLERIAEFVTAAALRLGLNEQQAFEIQMAVDEACANVIQHAYGPGVAGDVSIRCQVEGDDFVVTIRDHGRAFDPGQVAEPDLACPLEERQIGGLGLFFMRKLADRVVYRTCSSGNELKLHKRRPA